MSNPWTNKVTRRFLARGFVCGRKIADILRERHPKAQVYPLYRSAVAIEYDSENKTVKSTRRATHTRGAATSRLKT